MSIVSPFTGEVILDELDALVAEESAVDAYLRSCGPYYDFRQQLRERIAEKRGPAQLPRPRHRTDVQHRVARCSRCGSKT